MKKSLKFFTIFAIIFAMVSCSDRPLQDEQELVLKEESVLKISPPILTPPDPTDCTEETAWAGPKIFTRAKGGNWALYVDIETLPPSHGMGLFAGQKLIGVVDFDEINGEMRIRIYLEAECWSLQNVDEPIKIQGLDTPPEKNPAPGKFTTFKGVVEPYMWQDNLVYELTVPLFRYYLVHVDVLNCCE